MASIIMKRPTSPGNSPISPNKPSTSPVTEKRVQFSTKVVRNSKNGNLIKLLDVLKGIPETVALDDIFIEVNAKCITYPSDKAEGIFSIVSIEKKPNPKYKSTMDRYAVSLKKHEEDKKVWTVTKKKYDKDMKAYEESKRQRRLEKERIILLERMQKLDEEIVKTPAKKKATRKKI